MFGFKKGSAEFDKFKECESEGLFASIEEDYQDHLTNAGVAYNGEYIEHRHEESIVSLILRDRLTPYSITGPCFEYEKTGL